MRIKHILAVLVLAAGMAAQSAAAASGGLHEYGEIVDYGMLFPVAAGAEYTYYWDTFWASRSNGDHHAQDIMAPKMTPVVAPASGTIGMVNWSRSQDDRPNPDRCCTLTLDHDDGWNSWFIHLNNDTPGTDDGDGWGIAPGIKPGTHVTAGQVIGWVGDSGNAENTGSHLHYELRDPEGTIVNPIAALDAATRVDLGLTCAGRQVTIFGTQGADVLLGTDGDDVIHGRGGDDVIDAKGGDDLVCAGDGDDVVDGGPGADDLRGNSGEDRLRGGPGADVLRGGPGADRLHGQGGTDVLYGGDDNDRLHGGGRADLLDGGDGNDRFNPGAGHDEAYGGEGRDRFPSSKGDNVLHGEGGTDVADYRKTDGVAVDLAAGTSFSRGSDILIGIEDVNGSPAADVIIGDEGANVLRGFSGDDVIAGGGGDDKLVGGRGRDDIDGGEGFDWCKGGRGAFLDACENGPA